MTAPTSIPGSWDHPVSSEEASHGARRRYERLRPLIVWLGLTQLAWIGYWLLGGGQNSAGFTALATVWLGTMIVWLVAVSYAGRREFFLKHSTSFSNLQGVVGVVVFTVALFGTVPAARAELVQAATSLSDFQLVVFHTLRLLAIGTFIKYLHGELPLHFVILGTFPDFLFGVSAVVVTFLAAGGPVAPSFLLVWHVIGFSIFLGAGVSMFFSVPSAIRIFRRKPDASIVFRFPMLLAPNFTVPLFMLAHVLALIKLTTIR